VAPLDRAIRLSRLTVGWNSIVGVAAVATAIATSSLSLIGFGINAVIDASVSVLLIRRFVHEREERHERAARGERLALRAAGIAFLLIATYLTVQSIRAVANADHPGHSVFGIAEALVSLLVLPVLAAGKFRVARMLESRALRADSMLTWFGTGLAAVTVIALLLVRYVGWWWSDSVGALLIAAALIAEGARSLRGEA
jgi:divalent metal cation (Fe/Co/Zn/Cd) transporter